MLTRAAEKGHMSEADAKPARGRVEVIENMQDFAPCQVVIEAIKEDLDVKKAFFAELEGIVGENAILANNTSTLSVTKIGAVCKRPESFAGFHLFNRSEEHKSELKKIMRNTYDALGLKKKQQK